MGHFLQGEGSLPFKKVGGIFSKERGTRPFSKKGTAKLRSTFAETTPSERRKSGALLQIKEKETNRLPPKRKRNFGRRRGCPFWTSCRQKGEGEAWPFLHVQRRKGETLDLTEPEQIPQSPPSPLPKGATPTPDGKRLRLFSRKGTC